MVSAIVTARGSVGKMLCVAARGMVRPKPPFVAPKVFTSHETTPSTAAPVAAQSFGRETGGQAPFSVQQLQ